MEISQNKKPYVEFLGDGKIQFNINSLAEAKLAVRDLKLKRKAYSITKREITIQQQQIRASYTDENRRRGPTPRGRGAVFGIFRTVDQISRNTSKITLANKLTPLENEKARLDYNISLIDRAILQIEAYILQKSK